MNLAEQGETFNDQDRADDMAGLYHCRLPVVSIELNARKHCIRVEPEINLLKCSDPRKFLGTDASSCPPWKIAGGPPPSSAAAFVLNRLSLRFPSPPPPRPPAPAPAPAPAPLQVRAQLTPGATVTLPLT
eukprot:451460-Hanusia_phi.AAC.4